MTRGLRTLIVEDSEYDAELLLAELARIGYDVTSERVQTAEDMAAALEREPWDIVISDYTLPGFSGPQALDVLKASHRDLPFIIVSGTIGEEAAVTALKAGAHDFLVKNKLARLGPAIERELREAAARQERTRLEEQLRQAQKMEAVGQLAGGVAHDFNNLITAILGFCTLLEDQLEPGSQAVRDLVEIRRAGERATALARQLLAFSRQQVLQPRTFEVKAVIAELEPLLRQLLLAHIDLVLAVTADVGSIRMDPVEFEQVVLNLAINARDAMPRGGTLTISTANVALDEATNGRQLHAPPGPYVVLEVRDTGLGMDATVMARMFEPFFTTKPAGKGTGLGLSMVHGIIKRNDGDISATSEPGQGTAFRVFLPLAAERRPAGAVPAAIQATSPRGSETVLVVEDDPGVRELTRAALERRGYRVLEAALPGEAVRIAAAHGAPIDLLLSDIVMPESQGPPLIDRLKADHPALRVLYMSGYPDETILQQGVLNEGTPFLHKPFSLHALTAKVREVLDAAPAAQS